MTTQTLAHTYNAATEYRPHAVRFFLGLSVLLAGWYIASVYGMVSNTMAVRSVDARIAVLANQIKDLDSSYLSISGSITSARIKAHGLHEGDVTAFIPRVTSLGQVSMSGRSAL